MTTESPQVDIKVPTSEEITEIPITPPLTNGVHEPVSEFPQQTGISPSYPKVGFELEDRYIDEPRSLRVVVIGAGLTGITAGVLLPRKVLGIQLTIFEKNADVVSLTIASLYNSVRSHS